MLERTSEITVSDTQKLSEGIPADDVKAVSYFADQAEQVCHGLQWGIMDRR